MRKELHHFCPKYNNVHPHQVPHNDKMLQHQKKKKSKIISKGKKKD